MKFDFNVVGQPILDNLLPLFSFMVVVGVVMMLVMSALPLPRFIRKDITHLVVTLSIIGAASYYLTN